MKYDILSLIPQRPPVVMVDSFAGIDDGISVTGLTIRGDNIFCDGGVMSECGVIEHMAQSAAARTGYVHLEEGREVPVGFIGSVNRFEISRLPHVGETLRTELQIIQEVGAISLIEAATRSGDEVIAQGRMKIFLQNE